MKPAEPNQEEKKAEKVVEPEKQPASDPATKQKTNPTDQLKSKMASLTQKKSSLQSSIDRLKSKTKK